MRLNKKTQNIQKGVALIEFAIIVPLLLLLVIGVSEFGFAFYHLNILNKSVQDGTRYFSDPLIARKEVLDNPIDISSTNQDNIDAARNLIMYGNVNGDGSALLPPNDGSGYSSLPTFSIPIADHIQITATYNHSFILGDLLGNLTGGLILSSYSFTASSVMRVE